MPSLKSLSWFPSTVSIALACSIGYMPAVLKTQSDSKTEIHSLLERYFAAYGKKDLSGTTSLWSEKSPGLDAARQSFQKSFAASAGMEMKSHVVRKVISTGDKATANMVLEVSVIDPKTGKPSGAFEKKNRTLHLVNENGAWRVWRDVSSEEELAEAISAAETDKEREVLLEADKELITVDLRKSLITRGIQVLSRGRYGQAMSIFNIARTVAQDLDDRIGIAVALRGMANVHGMQGKYIQALELDEKSLSISNGIDRVGTARALNHMGRIHQLQTNYAQALEYYHRSQVISEEQGDRAGIAAVLNNIGIIHQLQGSYTKALGFYKKSATISEEAGERITLVTALGNIANIHQLQGDTRRRLSPIKRIS